MESYNGRDRAPAAYFPYHTLFPRRRQKVVIPEKLRPIRRGFSIYKESCIKEWCRQSFRVACKWTPACLFFPIHHGSSTVRQPFRGDAMIALDYYLDRATLAEYYHYRWTHPVETLRRRRRWYLFRWTTFYLIVAALSGAYAVDQGVLIQEITAKTETSATVVSRIHWAAPLSFVFLGFAVWLIFRGRKKFEEHLLRQAAGQAFKELHQQYGVEQSVELHSDRVEQKFLGYRHIAAIDCIEEIIETENAVFLLLSESANRRFQKIILPKEQFDTEKWTEIQNWVAARRSAVEEVLEAEPIEEEDRNLPNEGEFNANP
jgi:hypothetical protein